MNLEEELSELLPMRLWRVYIENQLAGTGLIKGATVGKKLEAVDEAAASEQLRMEVALELEELVF